MSAAVLQSAPHAQPSHGGSGPVLNLVAWGVPFQLAADTPETLDRMRRFAPYASAPCTPHPGARTFTARTAPSGISQVLSNGQLLIENESMAQALFQFSGHLMAHVAEYSPHFVFVHAGVVAWNQRALLLPGVSHAGKSTLVAELVRAGAAYYSDEFALLDSHGRVHPFARDLRIRRPGSSDQTTTPVAHLEGFAGTLPLPVALIAFTEYMPGAAWDPEPVSPGRAVLDMLLHTLPVQRTPARVMETLAAAIRNAAVCRSPRGEAALAAQALIAALSTAGASA
jgi:hypothetical protein